MIFTDTKEERGGDRSTSSIVAFCCPIHNNYLTLSHEMGDKSIFINFPILVQ